GRVVLLDFGLAAPLACNSGKTRGAGVLLGTRGYVSPEQSRGEPLSVASDWYGFGVTLFEAATGQRPFEGPLSAYSAECPVEGLGRISLLVPDAPPDLDDLIARLLDSVPRRRPDEAQVMSVLGGVAPAKSRTRSRPPPLEAHATEARALAHAVDGL